MCGFILIQQYASIHREDIQEGGLFCCFGRLNNLGLVFDKHSSDMSRVTLMSYTTLEDSSFGPCKHRGTILEPGDVLNRVTRREVDIAYSINSRGFLSSNIDIGLTSVVSGVSVCDEFKLWFTRQKQHEVCIGDLSDVGHSKKRVAKYPASGYLASGSGGAPARKGKKPEHSDARRQPTKSVVPEPVDIQTAIGVRVAEVLDECNVAAAMLELGIEMTGMTYMP